MAATTLLRQATVGLTPRGIRNLAIGGFIAALGVGALAGAQQGIVAGGIVAGLLGLFLVVILYIHRPFTVVLGFWAFLLFQDSIATAVGKSGSAGSAVTKAKDPATILLLLLTAMFGRHRVRGRWFVYGPAIGYLVAGLLSGAIRHVPPYPFLLGAFTGVRLYATMIIAMALPWEEVAVERVFKWIVGFAVPVAILTYLDFFAPGPFRAALHLPSKSDVRLGIQAARSIFPNPALLSSFMFLSLCALLARMAFRRRRLDIIWAVLIAVAAVLSLRLKAVAGIGTAFLVVVTFRPKSFGRAVGPAVVLLLVSGAAVGGIAYGVASRQVSTYTSTQTPRNRLDSTSIKIAQTDFPLGAGFGRFGSASSGPPGFPYSPVYDHYGFDLIPGLSRAKPTFLHDTSWATIIGETGALGWLFYAGGLVLLMVVLGLQARNDDQPRAAQMVSLAGVATLIAFMFDSAGRPALFDAFTCLSVALVVGPALALGRLPGPRPTLPDDALSFLPA